MTLSEVLPEKKEEYRVRNGYAGLTKSSIRVKVDRFTVGWQIEPQIKPFIVPIRQNISYLDLFEKKQHAKRKSEVNLRISSISKRESSDFKVKQLMI